MKKYILFIATAALAFAGCKKEFLNRPPEDQLSDDTYWTSESNVRIFAWDFYPRYFDGYGSGFTWGKYFSGQSLNDDFAPSAPTQFIKNIPTSASSTSWGFSWIRKANLYLNRIQTVPMEEAAVKHWSGIARFFRTLEYHNLVKRYGDVPWYGTVLGETDFDQLYKPRDSRALVVDSMLNDLKYAAENVRESDGDKGLHVNKAVVLAFMSRIMLYEGTYFKYHNIDQSKATIYLEAAKWAADQLITSAKYTIGDEYRSLFSSLSLASAKEIIMYRKYETGMITHALASYNYLEPQTGISKDAVDSYLANDGLPIGVSTAYQGDNGIDKVMANRDPRMYATVVNQLRISKYASNYSTSGFSLHKFLNESVKNLPEGGGSLNQTDAPIIRYAEVLLNYAEATAELGQLTQADLDKSVNVLRKRTGINMPNLQVMGDQPAINGVLYDDPSRDATVSSIIWEIRRERRIELMMEGFRYDDLRRWKKLDYTDTQANADINKGAWIRKADYPNTDVFIEGGAAEGYIIPATKAESQRPFLDPKVYLDPIPLDQIKLYEDNGYELKQNPGWQ
ncbi:RagB/SusD family nutrient uptake outer membrane protein [Flavihumibacter solisilvae]|uniref:Carbohydrate-binding protein SusD n=1 Tax=Flavihumibacter solisilvae TaxID=1349421 RepID=A0A0C1L465_9BACT|nr:RagB/SusD family nutrient uptake outer membrane protein [Flavihumibacter solisilvae]KIC94877.1 carbohydrate-binding protein SusD [Flavihumibacter solisilvae]